MWDGTDHSQCVSTGNSGCGEEFVKGLVKNVSLRNLSRTRSILVLRCKNTYHKIQIWQYFGGQDGEFFKKQFKF